RQAVEFLRRLVLLAHRLFGVALLQRLGRLPRLLGLQRRRLRRLRRPVRFLAQLLRLGREFLLLPSQFREPLGVAALLRLLYRLRQLALGLGQLLRLLRQLLRLFGAVLVQRVAQRFALLAQPLQLGGDFGLLALELFQLLFRRRVAHQVFL